MKENLRKHILSEYTNTIGMEMTSNPRIALISIKKAV